MSLKVNLILLLFLLKCLFAIGQNQNFDQVMAALDEAEYEAAILQLEKIELESLSNYDKGVYYFYLGDAASNLGNLENALEYTLRAKKIFLEEEEHTDVLDCNLLILQILNNNDIHDFDTQHIEQELKDYSQKQQSPKAAFAINNRIGSRYLNNDEPGKAMFYFRKNDSIGKKENNLRFSISALANISTVHSILTNQLDSALFYNQKAIQLYKKQPNESKLISHLYNNRARIFQDKKDYRKALTYFKKADSVQIKGNIGASKRIYYANISVLYEHMDDFKNAYTYLKKEKTINDSIKQAEQNIAISEIQTKYETEKKEKENAFLKSDLEKKKQTQTILWVIVVASIIIGSAISILIAKNASRKQQLAKQEEQLKIQQVEKELKEHELNSIDVLIDGQEKERQRLAENLHDNLGGTLAALKLNLQNLEQNQGNKEIADKSMKNSLNLINDAYQNVRQMAHEKSHGVVANQGLLSALNKLAQNISSDKLTVTIEHFGLKNRLENSLEIRLFRIIQELVTNIIKHANATEANISLTNHDATLNIVVEDNGKGFAPNKLTKNEGMGLATIEKRIENLGGKLEIDSYPTKGTSIVINIPLRGNKNTQ